MNCGRKLSQQLLRRVRFREKSTYIQTFELGRVLRIHETAHCDHFHRRLDPPYRADRARAVEKGHRHVGQDGGDVFGMLCEYTNCVGPVGRCQYTIIKLLECRGRDLSNTCFIVDDQYQLAIAGWVM